MEQNEHIRLSHSKIKTFLNCRQRYKWEYEECLTPIETSKALQVGDIVHRLLHLYHIKELSMDKIAELPNLIKSLHPENSEELTEEIVQQSAILMSGYLAKWKDDTLNVISSETWIEVEFPEQNFSLSGRIDALARSEIGRLWRLEHKTAARSDSAYLSGLKGSLQGAIYDYLTEQTFKETVEGTIYNLLVKTQIPKFERSYTKTSTGLKKRMLDTVYGVVRDIRRNDYYPSCNCFDFNRACDFSVLCDHDSPETRQAFFKHRTSPLEVEALTKKAS